MNPRIASPLPRMMPVLLAVLAANPTAAIPTIPSATQPKPGTVLGAADPIVRPAVPRRVASLNLCTDEMALMLAAPGQLVSVSRLGADPLETTVAGRATGLATNRGRVTDVVALAPDLILTSGGDGNATTAARRLGIAVVEMRQPLTLADVRGNIVRIAAALGRPEAGQQLLRWMNAALGGRPATTRSALMVSGGGQTIAADGLAAEWLRQAGLVQQPTVRGQVDLDALLARPPQVLVIARYRPGQVSANASWLAHPAMQALPASVQRLETDGRAWTCLGPPLADEIVRLRTAAGR